MLRQMSREVLGDSSVQAERPEEPLAAPSASASSSGLPHVALADADQPQNADDCNSEVAQDPVPGDEDSVSENQGGLELENAARIIQMQTDVIAQQQNEIEALKQRLESLQLMHQKQLVSISRSEEQRRCSTPQSKAVVQSFHMDEPLGPPPSSSSLTDSFAASYDALDSYGSGTPQPPQPPAPTAVQLYQPAARADPHRPVAIPTRAMAVQFLGAEIAETTTPRNAAGWSSWLGLRTRA